MTLSHADLVALGGLFARKVLMASVVLEDCKQRWGTGECPDVYAVTGNQQSIVIDAKTSINDWRADQQKQWRQPGYGMGERRYYLAEPGTIEREALGNSGWGLLLTDGESVIEEAESVYFEPSLFAERNLLAKFIADNAVKSPKADANTAYQRWLEHIQDHVVDVRECWAREALMVCGRHTYARNLEATNAVADAVKNGRLPQVNASRRQDRWYLEAI